MTLGSTAESWVGRTMSLEEWAALPEDEPGELVDGVVEEEERVGFAHDLVVAWLIGVLHVWTRGRRGLLAASDARFAVKANRGRKADLTVYLAGGRKPPAQGLIRVPPDIAVEVVSPTPRDGRRDRVEKLAEYAAFGVRWYWIVDPRLRSLEIFELGADGRYTYALGRTAGMIESVPGCEGLALDIDALWSELDQLGVESEETPEDDA